MLDPSEVGPEVFDPSANLNPYTLEPLQSNAVDPGLNAPVTDELLFGIEHALRPDPTDNVAGGIVDGNQVIQGSGTVSGAKGNVFISADWSYSVNGLYQIAPGKPWSFNVSANLNGRQGYPARYARRVLRLGARLSFR